MDIIEHIITLVLDESVKGWARVAIFAILVGGGVMVYWLKGVNQRTKSTEEKVDKIDKTLNTSNSGSHIKDQLDRIEGVLLDHTQKIEGFDERLGAIEDGSLTRFWAPFGGRNRDN